MTHYNVNGFLVDENGVLQVGNPPIADYFMGLPFDSEGRLVVQLNVAPWPGDAYVGGVRIGPNGGVYVVDITPPPEVDSFSDGYDGGFQ